jgi:4,5-dihydroxyphthalate decarboxylase
VLQHEFDVVPQDMEWVQTRGEHYSHTGASGTKPPVKLSFANAAETTLFLRGEIDAATGWGDAPGSALSRTGEDIRSNADFCTLFSNPKAEAIRFYQKNQIFPPHHTTAIRQSILDEHPWVALSLFNAFEEAKKIAMSRTRLQTLFAFQNHYLDEVQQVMGPDPFVYGVQANAAAIGMVQTISFEQSLTPRKQPLDEIFPMELLIAEERL